MALAIICGQPCSGKSTAAACLMKAIEKTSTMPVILIDEPSLNLDRNVAYQGLSPPLIFRGNPLCIPWNADPMLLHVIVFSRSFYLCMNAVPHSSVKMAQICPGRRICVECCGLQWTGQFRETQLSLWTPSTISRFCLAFTVATVISPGPPCFHVLSESLIFREYLRRQWCSSLCKAIWIGCCWFVN